MSEEDCQLLGLPHPVTQDQLKERWQKLALELHPDHGGDPEKFIPALAAYRRLSTELSSPPPCAHCRGTGHVLLISGFVSLRIPCPTCSNCVVTSWAITWEEKK